ncbi:PH domain-containing protein [Gammaproteobacteria bacterium]|nr:PH domain-containing protein [Gammaproteobacteria bacterium]
MSIDFKNKGYLKLKQNDDYAEKVFHILVDGETIIDSYKSMRDGVVFTNKRIIAVDVQGITGSKKEYASLPYKNIVAFSIETAGTFDLDAELEIWFSSLGKLKFEFKGSADIATISKYIAEHTL